MKLALLVSLLVAGCTCAGGDTPADSGRVERILGEVQRGYPTVEQHFAGMPYEAAFAAGAALVMRGLARLSDTELHDYAAVRARLLAVSDASCEAMVGGGDDTAAAAALEALDDDTLRAWARVTTHAQALELAGGPRPMPAMDAMEASSDALTRIEARLPPAEVRRWSGALGSADASEACFVERVLMREAAAMPEAESGPLLRALLEASVPPS